MLRVGILRASERLERGEALLGCHRRRVFARPAFAIGQGAEANRPAFANAVTHARIVPHRRARGQPVVIDRHLAELLEPAHGAADE
jgi:hypothetical protein